MKTLKTNLIQSSPAFFTAVFGLLLATSVLAGGPSNVESAGGNDCRMKLKTNEIPNGEFLLVEGKPAQTSCQNAYNYILTKMGNATMGVHMCEGNTLKFNSDLGVTCKTFPRRSNTANYSGFIGQRLLTGSQAVESTACGPLVGACISGKVIGNVVEAQ